MDDDVVFSPATLPIAELRTTKPIVFWADATFDGMVGFYSDSASTCARSLRDGHNAEQKALSRCHLAIYASDWAAQSAIEHYDIDAAKIKVVPLGANMECSRTASEIARMVESRRSDRCRLLFCGTDWNRKGGALALRVSQELNDMGLRTELHIVGCRPPQQVPSFVKVHGFVFKRTPQGRELLDQWFGNAHFLIVPSQVECFGIVFSEASSFGVPSLSRGVGGIPTAIRNDCNGRLFAVDAYSDIQRFPDRTSRPVTFDIGANTGQTTSHLKERIPDSVIHAFEPNKSAYDELVDNTKKMRDVHLNDPAVGARAEKRPLIENTCSVMSSFPEPGECCWGEIAGRRMVEIVTVDEYCRRTNIEHIDVLKTDTQGYDQEVLRGARSMLDRDAVRPVYMEVTFSDMYKGLPPFDEIFRFLTDHGFRLVSFYEFFYQDHVAGWSDALFVNRQYCAAPRVQALPGDCRTGVKRVQGARPREPM